MCKGCYCTTHNKMHPCPDCEKIKSQTEQKPDKNKGCGCTSCSCENGCKCQDECTK